MPANLRVPQTEEREGGNGRRASVVDYEIGQRIKAVRSARRMTQEDLSVRLRISCQQLQKYEYGTNRISVSRLVEIAQHLEVDISELLTTASAGHAPASIGGPTAKEIKDLVNVFCDIENAEARARVLDMARFFSSFRDGRERTD